MKAVVDRVVQYPNRYKLTNAETNEVLGVFDFIPEMGTIQVVGTPINKELFDSIKTDIEAKLKASGGDSKDLIVTFTEATIRANISSKETHSTIFGKIKKWFADLKALAFKDKVSNADINTDADIDKSKIKGAVLLTGTADPTTATVGVVDQLYRNTTSGQVFICTAVGKDSYTWEDYTKNKANADASNLTSADVTSLQNKCGFERIETIYDKSSTDPNINWGYTDGITTGTGLVSKDLSKYKKLICTVQWRRPETVVNQYFGYGQVICDLQTNHGENYYGGQNTILTFNEAYLLWAVNCKVYVPINKSGIGFKGTYSSSKQETNTATGYLIKVEGVY